MTTPAQFKRLLASAEARAERLRRELRLVEQEVEVFRRVIDLHENEDRNILEQMQEQSLGLRIAAGRKNQSASRKAQIAAGLTDREVADKLGVSRLTVCKWHLGTTAIPAAMADKLAALKPKSIPRVSWPKIAG